MAAIDLRTPLTFRSSLRFPLQSAAARRDVLIGAALLVLLPGVGWLLNMGHRIAFVRRMQSGQEPFPSFSDPSRPLLRVHRDLLVDGVVTFAGMVYYHVPGSALMALGLARASHAVVACGAVLWLAATAIVPGYMTHYCKERRVLPIFDPRLALRHVRAGGARYWYAWCIALAGLALSFLGVLALGVGFFVTSVWFWQVAGFSFASVFSQRYGLVTHRRAAAQGAG